jgi:hypothetical protein
MAIVGAESGGCGYGWIRDVPCAWENGLRDLHVLLARVETLLVITMT